MAAYGGEIAHEIGMTVAEGVRQVLDRVQSDARTKGIEPQAYAIGIMDGMIHNLAMCVVWLINCRRGRNHELNREQANEIHERLKSRLVDGVLVLMDTEVSRLHQSSEFPEPGEREGHA
jgi:hypothetical protein